MPIIRLDEGDNVVINPTLHPTHISADPFPRTRCHLSVTDEFLIEEFRRRQEDDVNEANRRMSDEQLLYVADLFETSGFIIHINESITGDRSGGMFGRWKKRQEVWTE